MGYSISGSGETILLFHSSMSSKSQWKQLITQLEKSYQIIAFDLYGYGDAPCVENPKEFSLSDELNRIEDILETEGCTNKPVHVIGHSYGGATALKWCFENHQHVKSLAIFEPVAFHLLDKSCEGFKEIERVVLSLSTHLNNDDERAASQHFINYWSGEGAFQSFPPHIQDNFLPQIHKVCLDFQALIGEPLTLDDYATLSFPITLVMGTKSPLSSQTISLSLREHLPHLNFVEIECGHMGPITHPHLVNPVFVEALKKVA